MSRPYMLYIDDDPDEHDMMLEAFTALDGRDAIRFAADGLAALAFMERASADNHLPSIILLDINMPKLSGIETLKLIRASERFKSIRVIMYSTTASPVEQTTCFTLGADEFIQKGTSYRMMVQMAEGLYARLLGS